MFGCKPSLAFSKPFVLCHGKKFSSLALFCQPQRFSSWKSHDPGFGVGAVVSGVVVVAGVVVGWADGGLIEQSPSNASKTNSSTATYPELESLWEVMNWICKNIFPLIVWTAHFGKDIFCGLHQIKWTYSQSYLIFRITFGLNLYSTLKPLPRITLIILWIESPHVFDIIVGVIDDINIKIIYLIFWLLRWKYN